MNLLQIRLENCYGIKKLDHDFDFSIASRHKTYAIYAPNGFMKTSFTKSFEQISKGEHPKEERYGRQTTFSIEADDSPLAPATIHVLKSEIDIASDSPAVTDILVNPEHKARYDTLLVDLESLKSKLITNLQRQSKIKKTDIEAQLLKDWDQEEFPNCIDVVREHEEVAEDLSPFVYATLFDPAASAVLQSPEFITNATEFNNRYQELFEQEDSIYQKGVFNPTKAETSFNALDKQGYFSGGHRVHLKGDPESIDKAALDQRLAEVNELIDGDPILKGLKTKLAKNAKTQALIDLLETLTPTDIEYLLEKLKPENISQFKKDLWAYYLHENADATAYLSHHSSTIPEIAKIEEIASQNVPRWTNAIELFNDRFVDMPFTLSLANQTEAVLGKKPARLLFTFTDSSDSVAWSRAELKTLSQGEKRALHLLNFIFEVEARKISNQETLFIIDDAADSFDYKNKHAIVQYLADLNETESFHQIILTHNYDFFRTVAESHLAHRENCLMANKEPTCITLSKADGISNYFIGMWKDKVMDCEKILYSTVPFTRNLLEYTKGTDDTDYLTLTSLLHWKSDTAQITVGHYLEIYNRLFETTHSTADTRPLKAILSDQADSIATQSIQTGLNLEDKVVLSMAIRMEAEIYMLNSVRDHRDEQNYWPAYNNQFGKLLGEYSRHSPPQEALKSLRKVSITVSSNIHLNSFMYEPILDLGLDYLIALYNEVSNLNTQ